MEREKAWEKHHSKAFHSRNNSCASDGQEAVHSERMSSLPSHNNAGQGALWEPRGTCAWPLQGAGDSQPTAELPACPSRAGPWRWTRGLRRYIGDEEQESSFPTLCSQEQSAGGRLHATLNSTCIHTLTLVLERLNPAHPVPRPSSF